MTSALLSMLDTPEEAAWESGEEDSPHKRSTNDASEMLARLHLTPQDDVPQEIIRTTEVYDDEESRGKNEAFLRSLSGGIPVQPAKAALRSDGTTSSWSPTWNGAKNPPQQQEEQGEFLSSVFHPGSPGSRANQPPSGSNIGIYLP